MTDILSRIDAATEGLCACGCRRQLDPGGPSAWFASELCQRRWTELRTDRPREVYARPEAAYEVELDAVAAERGGFPAFAAPDLAELEIALVGMFGNVPRLVEAAPPEVPDDLPYPGHLLSDPGWRSAVSGPVAWRRWCGRCREFVRPVDGVRPLSGSLTWWAMCHLCERCRTVFPGPRMVAQWRDARWASTLRLAAGAGDFRVSISRDLHVYPESVALAWQETERGLLDALTYTSPCMVSRCAETARAFYDVSLGCRVLGIGLRAGQQLKVCPRHRYDLMRDTDYASWIAMGTP